MKLEFDMSKISINVLRRIAYETDELQALEQLAQSEHQSVVEEVVSNPDATKELRGKIYTKWAGYANDSLLQKLAECPLNSDTIHKIVKEQCDRRPSLCEYIVSQADISTEDLGLVYETVTAGDLSQDFVVKVLTQMAESANMDEDLLQKLVDYSPEVAAQVALHHSNLIRVDFSKRQTE